MTKSKKKMKKIPDERFEELDFHFDKRQIVSRRFFRQIASELIAAMSRTDMSFEDISSKLEGDTAQELRIFVHGLIEGAEMVKHSLTILSDMCFAMNLHPVIDFDERDSEFPPPPPPDTPLKDSTT